VAHLEGILDAAGVGNLVEEIKNKAVGDPVKVVLDFAEVDALDPLGLVEVLQLSTWMKDRGGRLRVSKAAEHVENAFRDNMISDVDFFADIESATQYAAAEPAPVAPVSEPMREPVSPPPKKKPKKKSKLWLWWLLGVVVLLLIGAAVVGMKWFLKPSDPVFEVVGVTNLEDLRIKPGETQQIQFKVQNAEQIIPRANPDWVEMSFKQSGEKEGDWTVDYRLRPTKGFSETLEVSFFASKGEKRFPSPKVFVRADVVPTPPKFDLRSHEVVMTSGGKKGYLLDPGQVGEQYGPAGLVATGGPNVRYEAYGYKRWGLFFEPNTGKFTGVPDQPTREGEYAEITIVANNGEGEPVETLALVKINDVPKGDPGHAFESEIHKRFRLVDKESIPRRENFELLMQYKDAVLNLGSREVHKVSTVYFGLGKRTLSYQNRRKLGDEFDKGVFRELASKSSTYFFVLGYADKGKTRDAINKPIIAGRAKALRDCLVDHLKERHGYTDSDIKEVVRVIPMVPIPTEEEGMFGSAERSRAGEIWLVGDPRKQQ